MPYRIKGCVLSMVERLDDEFTKILQNADCHSTDYVEKYFLLFFIYFSCFLGILGIDFSLVFGS